MKKIFLLGISLSSLVALSQNYNQCASHQAILEHDAIHPGYKQHVDEVYFRNKQIGSQDRSTVYTIPVVVHIVFNTPEENLDDSVIFNQIERLNEDYRRLNADTTNTRSEFETIVGDSFIEFQLASVDPDGNPTTGITRTYTTQSSFLGVGGTPAEGVKSTSSGGIDPWDQTRYLNIWVCDMSLFGVPFLLGYATPPAGLPHWPAGSTDGMSDGVVIQYQAFGSNNPNALDLGSGPIDVQGRTTVHEVGHYLGLRHIWGDGDCTAEDGIDDTPNADAQSDQDCDFLSNTCVDNIGTLGDLPDMVENYMDYSAETCQNSFTLGQIDMMRAILENERFDLINNNPALGMNEANNFTFSLFPNPSNGIVYLQTPVDFSGTAIITNEAGQVISYHTITGGQNDLPALKPGIYFIRVENEDQSKTSKLVIL